MEKSNQLPGKPVSLWIETTPKTNYPKIKKKNKPVDVAIIGGGISGLTAAYFLKEAGLKTALFESGEIIKGATGNTTAKITSQHGLIYDYLITNFGQEMARIYASANQSAIERIAMISQKENINCDYERKEAITFSENADSLDDLKREVEAAQSLGLPAKFSSEIGLPFPTVGAVIFENQAQFHPRKYLLGLSKIIQGEGSEIYENSKVLDIKEEKNICYLKLEEEEIQAKYVYLATSFPIINRGGYFSKMYPKRSYVLGFTSYSPAPKGMYYSHINPYKSLRSHPFRNEELLILGGENHKTGEGGDTAARYLRLEEFARRYFRVKKIEYRWSTQDNVTYDRVPYIGKIDSDSKRVFIATGFGGWGMTTGTFAAEIIKNEILKFDNPWLELFSPQRKRPAKAAKEFLAQNLQVAKHFALKRFSEKGGDNIKKMKVGEGKIFKSREERIAAYRNEQGKIIKLSASCTHMGCIVDWNNAEESWDCPCHGSRFDKTGKVIHSPAVEDLEKIE